MSVVRRVVAAVTGMFALSAAAADPPAALTSGGTLGPFFQVLFGLAMVVGAIGFTAWLLRRTLPTMRGAAGGHLKVVGGVMVGPKERVVVVEVDGTWLVLGVTATQVNTLHSIPKPPDAVDTGTGLSADRHFAHWLSKAMRKS